MDDLQITLPTASECALNMSRTLRLSDEDVETIERIHAREGMVQAWHRLWTLLDDTCRMRIVRFARVTASITGIAWDNTDENTEDPFENRDIQTVFVCMAMASYLV